MFATLDFSWKPTDANPTPPSGKAPAIIRNDTFTHTLRVVDGVTNGFDTWTWLAQIRTKRLAAGVTADAPLAAFTVTLENDGADLLIHLSLTSTATTALSLGNFAYWDLQLSKAGVVATWLEGIVKVLDDVSRAA